MKTLPGFLTVAQLLFTTYFWVNPRPRDIAMSMVNVSWRQFGFIMYAAWPLFGLSIVHDVMVYWKVKWLPIIYFVYKSEDFQPITQDEEEIKCLRKTTRKKLMSIPTRIAMYLNSLFVEPSSFENSIITVHT